MLLLAWCAAAVLREEEGRPAVVATADGYWVGPRAARPAAPQPSLRAPARAAVMRDEASPATQEAMNELKAAQEAAAGSWLLTREQRAEAVTRLEAAVEAMETAIYRDRRQRRPGGAYSYFKAIDDCGEDGCVLLPIAVEDFASASKGVAEKYGRLVHFAAKVQGGLSHLEEEELKALGPELEEIIAKDAEHAATIAYDENWAARVRELAQRGEDVELDPGAGDNRLNRLQLIWARTEADRLLEKHGYRTLVQDPVFGPFLREAMPAALAAEHSEDHPRRMGKRRAQAALFAANRLVVPAPGKRRLQDAVVTEALQLMRAEYSRDFVALASEALETFAKDYEDALALRVAEQKFIVDPAYGLSDGR